ncbi:hypothetical protein T190130A13A_10243 [Tenacibaculum sp. 190130A14a]|uniref:Uncharacterized protein n=1 Tax=Tenacibaculum polynesiense TaxID=3137857 RepID=A0ABM9P907_9FLAO
MVFAVIYAGVLFIPNFMLLVDNIFSKLYSISTFNLTIF